MTATKKKATSVDLTEFRTATISPRMGCSIAKIAIAMARGGEQEHVDKLRAAIEDDTITHVAIEQVLKSWGHTTSKDSVSRHRRGMCACPRD